MALRLKSTRTRPFSPASTTSLSVEGKASLLSASQRKCHVSGSPDLLPSIAVIVFSISYLIFRDGYE